MMLLSPALSGDVVPALTMRPQKPGFCPPSARAGQKPNAGALTILEALSQAHQGLNLTELSRASGLAKASAAQIVRQLVAAGAARRVDHRYFIGPMTGGVGRFWQPDPLLRQVCTDPVRRLTGLTGATASVYAPHLRHARLVAATVPVSQSWVPPDELDLQAIPPAAIGLVLLAARPGAARPPATPQSKWVMWRRRIRDEQFVITGSDRVPAGHCCVAAPIWDVHGDCAGAAAVLPRTAALSARTIDALLDAARRIGHALRAQQSESAG